MSIANTGKARTSEDRSLIHALKNARPLYLLPKDDVLEEVLIPALMNTRSLNVMIGYFSSYAFVEIAPGLATFLRRTKSPLQIVVSPFLTENDFALLSKGGHQLHELAEKLLVDDVPDEDALIHHTMSCLAWLITQHRLEFKIAILQRALFHPKVWLLDDGMNQAALHGSSNFTKTALSNNREQLTLSRSWRGTEAKFHIDRLTEEFDTLWSGGDNECRVLPLPEAVARKVIDKFQTQEIPNEDALKSLWSRSRPPTNGIQQSLPPKSRLKIPAHIHYKTGDYSHQGLAVRSWEEASHRGILEMATGSGKTITAMICAARLQERLGNLMVVVTAPYRPLIEQWCEEISEFSVRPINLSTIRGPLARAKKITDAGRRLRLNYSFAEVLVTSNATFCSKRFLEALAAVRSSILLVADECHNLGSASFVGEIADFIDYRLGLSATPIRQYDDEGTAKLKAYFGDICFSYTLKKAIGKCLTQYDYHVHSVELSSDEMEDWIALTEKITKLSWKFGAQESDPYLDGLLRRRRLILETASGKLDTLAMLLDRETVRQLEYVLIYATDKDPEQLQLVNRMLSDRDLMFHQFTELETRDRQRAAAILSDFQSGLIKILTAKRVLDEGVNIPQIKLAYLLASTTVKRQWIQRRGRLLRQCKSIGKTHAVIHDFVVLPPYKCLDRTGVLDQDSRRLVRSELKRVWEFSRLSRNRAMPGGPYDSVRHLQKLANEWVIYE